METRRLDPQPALALTGLVEDGTDRRQLLEPHGDDPALLQLAPDPGGVAAVVDDHQALVSRGFASHQIREGDGLVRDLVADTVLGVQPVADVAGGVLVSRSRADQDLGVGIGRRGGGISNRRAWSSTRRLKSSKPQTTTSAR